MPTSLPFTIRPFVRLSCMVFTVVLLMVSLPLFVYGQRKGPVSAQVSYMGNPLAFEANPVLNPAGRGFSARGHRYTVELTKDGASISFSKNGEEKAVNRIGLRMLGSNDNVVISPELLLPGVSNYMPTADRSTWRMGVEGWGRVKYAQIYDGIDLSFYSQEQFLEYDFRLKPRADAGNIRLAINGAEDARIDAEGNLALTVGGSPVVFRKPVSYQLSSAGVRELVSSDYVLAASSDHKEWQISFHLGDYDKTRELVIDPVLSYGLQPAFVDYTISGIANDTAGNTYVTGQNQSRGFYVTKYNASGTLVFNTVVGSGTVTCYPTGISVDSTGKIYVVGESPKGLPTTANAYQATSPSVSYSVPFVAVFPATGAAPTYLSYLGGTNNTDYASGMAVDSTGHLYITGYEESTTFPTTAGAILSTYPGASYAAFVAKIDPTKSGAASLVYSTLLGAPSVTSVGVDVAVDASGDAYVAVLSYQGYPVTDGAYTYSGAYAQSYNSGNYVTKINPTGTAILYSAYLGPGAPGGIAVDTNQDAYITGTVSAEDFPTTAGAYQTSYPGGFVTELNPAGSTLVYSTFLSGPSGAFSPSTNSVFPQSIALLPGCASVCPAYIGGYTNASDFPAVNAIQDAPLNNTTPSAIIVEISGDGASALFSSYLGGIYSSVTSPFSTPLFPTPAVSVDGSGNMYLAANANGVDFPATFPSGTQIPYSFIAKVSPSAGGLIIPYPQKLNFDSYNGSGQAVGVSSAITGVPVPLLLRNMGSSPATISSLTFSPATEFGETDSCNLTIPAGGTCTLNLNFLPSATGVRTATLAIASNASVSPVSIPLSGTGVVNGYLQVSTSSVTFPDAALGSSSAQQMITVTNIAKGVVNLQPLTVSTVRSNWGNGSDFQVLSNCPAKLAAAASCTIGVTFTPLATGPRAAGVYLSGDGFGNQYVYLYGTGISGTSEGTVALSAAILNFNTQIINTVSNPRQAVVLTNTSTAPISVYGLSIATKSQTSGSDFSIYSGSCVSTSLISLSPQASCTINVQFLPTNIGAETGTLTVSDSAMGGTQTVALTGTGLAAIQSLEFSPGNFVFPDQPLNSTSTADYFYVYNTGTAPITVDRIVTTGDFHLYSTSCAGAILKSNPAVGYEPYPSCNVRVQFTPTALGLRTGTIAFIDSATTNQQVLNLTGMGITATGAVFLEPSSLVYPAQAIGTTSVTQRVNIVNPGNSPVSITDITTTGDYAIVNNCTGGVYPAVLGVGRSCGLDISFTPTSATNPNKGSVIVASTGGTATLPITGTGVAATTAIGLTPTALNFGSVVNATASFTYNVYVRNTGTTPITLTSATITGAAASDYGLSGGSCGFYGNVLAVASSCYVQVNVTPSATGTRAASLSLIDSAGTQTAALTASGVASITTGQAVPNGVAYDLIPVGSASPNAGIQLHNNGTAPLAISTAQITAGGSAFVIPSGLNGCTGATVAAGSYCNVSVSFSPTVAGYQTGTLTFTDSKSVNYTVSLAGYSPAVATSSYLDPTSLAFPAQVLTTISSTQLATLYNTSNVPMTVGTLTGTNTIVGTSTTGVFSLNSTQGGYDGCSGVTIAAHNRCQVNIAFAPTAVGNATGTVVFPATYGNGGTIQFSLSLSGTGVAVKNSAEVSPASLVFSDQAVGAVSGAGADQTQTINVVNSGNLPITIGTLAGSDVVIGSTVTGDFTTASAYGGYDGCSSQTIAPSSTCTITVAFNPATAAAKSGSVKFPVTYSDKTTATLTATLTGKGIAAGSTTVMTPSSGQFDVQVVGTTSDSSQALSFTLYNTGNLPVKITTATITSNFSFINDSCSGTTVPVSSNCVISVAFSPTKTGVITGSITIPNSSATKSQKIALTGTGISATQQMVLSQSNITFGNQVVGTKSGTVYVLVSNQSGATVPISSVVLSGANPADFSLNDGCSGQSVGPHSNCQLIVQFSPAATSLGARAATITETDTASGGPRVLTLTGTGVSSAPSVAFYPASLNFGSQGLSTKSAPLTFSITNTGPATSSLTITKIVSSNTEFAIASNTCSTALAGGVNCLVSVTFTPNAGSTQTATISVTDNATGSPQTLTATGLSVGIPQAKLSAASIVFASQGVGTVSTAHTLTLSNAGTDTLNIASIAISGTNAADFSQTNTCGTSIAAATSCTISVLFDPAAVGSRAATITVTDNAGNTVGSTQAATLSGTGTGVQKIAFSPTSLTFPSTGVGANSAAQTITVSNPGTAALAITGISIVPTGDYTETTTCGTSLAAGTTCAISVIFKPTVAGTRTASVSVADGATGSPHTVALTGTAVGVPAATLSASTVTFPSQAIGVVSAAQTLTLTNTGTGSLVVASVKLSGTNYPDFTATSTTCPGTLAPAAACTISITFKPAAAGTRSALLTITDNSGNVASSTQKVTITGTGAGTPKAVLSATTMVFSSTPVDKAQGPQTITLANTGNAPLQVASVTLTGANASDYIEFDTCTPTVAAGANCEIALYFFPSAVGTRTASVVVTDNAGNLTGATQTLAVSGTATGAPQVTLSTTTLAFGTVKVATQSNGQAVTLANSGNSPLTVTSVVLAGTDPADYSLYNSCTAVSAGSNCLVVVFFKPTATGSRPATLTFTDNANNVAGTKQTVTLTGTGN